MTPLFLLSSEEDDDDPTPEAVESDESEYDSDGA